MTKNHRIIGLLAITLTIFLTVALLVWLGILGINALCGWKVPQQMTGKDWSCKCLGMKTTTARFGNYSREYCTGLNLSYNRLVDLSKNQHPVYKEDLILPESPSTNTPVTNTLDTESTVADVADLTLNPTADWVEETLCNISFRRSPELEIVTGKEGPEIKKGEVCYFALVMERPDVPYPLNLNISVFTGYDGGSRRAYYLKARSSDYINDPSYKDAEEFVAGVNKGLWLVFNDQLEGYSENIYLVARDSKTLIAVNPGANEPINDVIKMFLTSLE